MQLIKLLCTEAPVSWNMNLTKVVNTETCSAKPILKIIGGNISFIYCWKILTFNFPSVSEQELSTSLQPDGKGRATEEKKHHSGHFNHM